MLKNNLSILRIYNFKHLLCVLFTSFQWSLVNKCFNTIKSTKRAIVKDSKKHIIDNLFFLEATISRSVKLTVWDYQNEKKELFKNRN